VYTPGEVHALGDEAFDEDAYQSWIDAVDVVGDLASLIYTSGTTGQPKGVRLTPRQLQGERLAVLPALRGSPGPRQRRTGDQRRVDDALVSPLAHVFERMAGHYMMFAAGATVGYAESPDTLREDFGLVRPTTTTSVPRVYEKLYDAIREQAGRRVSRERADLRVGSRRGKAHHEADEPGAVLNAKCAVADRLVFSSVREAIGGNIDFFISGGGSLSAELCALYHAMDLPILEGYGLTETSPSSASTRPRSRRSAPSVRRWSTPRSRSTARSSARRSPICPATSANCWFAVHR